MSNTQDTTYSISWGPEHKRWASDPRTMIEVLERAVTGGKGIVHIKPDGSEVNQSYADVLSSAQRVLGALRARGLQPGDKVIVEVQDSFHFLPVFWGCLLGGFIAAPMHTPSSFHPDSNEMRKTKNVWMLLDEPLLVCDGYIEEKYLTLQEHPLFSNLNLATAEELLAHEPDLDYHRPHPDDIAFLQFSSGSTGNAKGVELSHAKLIFNCGAMAQCYEYTSEDVFANWMPLYHDMGLICFHLIGVLNGLKQIKMSHDTFLRRPELLLRKITEHKATVSGSPNFGLEWITTKVQDLSGFDLSSLRVFYNGAEPISVQVKEAFEEKLAVCGLRKNVVSYVYGMAETCVGSTGCPVGERSDVSHRIDQKKFNSEGIAVPVTDPDVPYLLVAEEGIPFAGMGVRIVNDHDELLPEWQVGHVQLAGMNVTSGYYRNPEANASLFCGEWLRTGDMGFMVNGRLCITGRVKDVIFVNGQNFYAHDIEELLIHTFKLQNQTVVAVGFTDQKSGRERVYVFIKYKRVNEAFLKLAQDIKATINIEVGFEIDGVIPVKSIPKTTSGKLERYNMRNRLIEGEFDELLEEIRLKLSELSNSREDLVLPRTETEQALHKIWHRIFAGLPETGISVTDHFMALGGNSLKAMQLVRDLEEEFGHLHLDLIQLFEHPTIEKLAKYVEDFQGQGAVRERKALRPTADGGQEEYDLSHSQRGLWFIQQMEPQSVVYNEHYQLQINGALDVDAFDRALQEIVARHAALRTVFAERDGHPTQRVLDRLEFALPLVDLAGLNGEEGRSVFAEALQEDLRTPFDFASGPLFRFKLFRIGENQFCFYMIAHHIISDGWSMDVLFEELKQLYTAFSGGKESPLAPLPIQFGDYAVWQQEWLADGVMEEQLAYWNGKLACLPVLELPTDRPRPPMQTHNGRSVRFELPKRLTDALKEMSLQQGATLYMSLLGAFQTLLSRYSGQRDIAVGTPVAGRHHRGIGDLIGFFVNTLVMRTDLSGEPSFRELVHRVRATALEAFAHQDVPFELLVEELQPERDMSRSPLFQVMFVLQNAMFEEQEFAGLKVQRVDTDSHAAKFDLALTLTEQSGALVGSFEYSTDLFEDATIERMIGHYRTLLEEVVANPEVRIHRLQMLTEQERELLAAWNDTGAEVPASATVVQLFEAQADQTPDHVAVQFEGERLTYRELNQRANQLAHFLRGKGVGPDRMVGVVMERSLEMVVALYGIFKAGGAYLPIDPAYPSDRIALTLEDSQAVVLLTQQRVLASLPEHGAQVVCMDSEWELIARESLDNPAPVATDAHLAYAIYTSGSTGKPKGVLVEHGALANALLANQAYMKLQETDVLVSVTSISFDPAVLDLCMPLVHGASVVIASRETANDGVRLAALLERVNATLMQATAATFNLMLQGGWNGHAPLRVVCGGEALSRELIQALSERTAEIWNAYGPTEATVCTTAARMEPGQETVVIGRPLPNYTTYILDEHLQPVPVGVVGELYIGGRGLARGYLNRPDLTEEAFAERNGERLYKTGDLARYHGDGQIEHLGRADGQVKVRGFRIELGEIESVLMGHEAVREAVVTVREAAGDKRLAAYLVLDGGASAEGQQWRAYLRERMPAYMVPSAFVVLDALPLSPNGKVDRKALPEPDASAYRSEAYVAPRTELENIVAGIWSDVLRVGSVGVHDNFFEAGGHSLLATQVVSRLAGAFSVQVPLKVLFEAPTIAELSSRLEQLQDEQQGVAGNPLPLQRVSREEPLPLSFAQQRLWVLDRLMSGGAVYNVPNALRMQGALNAEALERALAEIVNRHEVLRTTFAEVNGEPVQVLADTPVGLERIDLSDETLDAREERVQRMLQDEMLRPFDLAVGPLVRFALVRMGEEEHLLLANFHHIIFDGWSMEVLYHELAHLYEAFAAGEESPLAPLAVQYADYAVWQREWLKGDVLDGQLDYWSRKLADLPVLQLPTDRPRPLVQTYNGRMEQFRLTKELTDALQAVSQQQGATLYMTLLGAFQILLARYSGQADIVVGSPIAGRHQQEIEELIGFFVNTLVMRTDLSGEPSFRDVLKRVRETALDAYAHQDVPFEKLVEELQPERDMSRSPLFQVLFVLQNTRQKPLELNGLRIQPVELESLVSKFDLTLSMWEQAGELGGSIEYNTDLFDAATIKRMAGHLRLLLEGIAANPEAQIHQLPMLTEEEQDLLAAWNDTGAEVPASATVIQLFEAQADKTPEHVAVQFEGEQLTYRELNQRANQLAHFLRGKGVGPDQMVGVVMERSWEMVVALYGILKAGGAYLPIDPAYPSDRIALTLEDSQAVVLLTQEHLYPSLPEHGAQVVCIDSDWKQVAGESCNNPAPVATDAHLAYAIYTSGSTGKPKGVLVEHGALANALFANQAYMKLQETDVLVSVTSISFDPAVLDLCMPLVHGASVVIASRETTNDGARLAALLERVNATLMQATAATYNLMLQGGWNGHAPLRVVCGGEALSRELIQALSERTAEIWNAYGPTEATICTTAARMEPGQETVVIGRPLPNYTTYILDEHLQPVPVGVTGELYIGGRGLARGYLNRPDLTEAAFAERNGERLYKTGDLARYHADGQIEHLGRADGQVKVRGFRIELGEIESVLMQHEAVREAVVTVREMGGDKRLVAYLVLDGDVPADGAQWRAYLRERVPAYMVPSAFVVLEAMPLSPNGKVDRKALPEPDASAYRSEAYVAPRTELEKIVAGIWSDVLRVESLGMHDNFFEAGGHSLLATQVVSRLAGACSVQVPLKVLFEAPTIAELSSRIERLQEEQQGMEWSTIQRVSREEPLPLSFAQQRLWVLDRLMSGGTVYNIPGALRLKGALNEAALEMALAEIVNRHEVLRTTFAEVNGEPVQVIASHSSTVLEKTDLRAWPDEQREVRISSLLKAEVEHSFDLTVGPLVRFSLIRVGDEEHVLIQNFHHIISDGWSMEVLFNELSRLYAAFAAGEESPLAPLAVQYADYAVWQREWLDGEVLNGQLAYWSRKLAELQVLQLPTDRARPPVQTHKGRMELFDLTKELTDALQALSQEQGVTLYMTLLAAFQTLLARYSGQEDIVVGTPIAGRQRREIEDVIGFFVNTLVMRTDLSGKPSFREVLNRVRETALDAYAHQDVPFEKLVEELQPDRDMSRSALFQVMFVLQNTSLDGPSLADLQVSPIVPENLVSKFELTLTMWEQSGVLTGGLEYNTDLFDEATIQRMAGHLRVLLEGIVANPEAQIHQLPILTEEERHQLLYEWNDTGAAYDLPVTTAQLFEAQVEKTPDQIAVQFEGDRLTYRELNQRANQLAHFLRGKGVRPDQMVGVAMERSLEVVVALYGILKAGGTYLPLDPAYPSDRIQLILEDSQAALLLTQQHLLPSIPMQGAPVVCIDSEWEQIEGESLDNPPPVATASHLAYAIYTSGSTGRPKGVLIEHGALTNALFANQDYMRLGAGDVFVAVTSISFDPAMLEMCVPLVYGATVVVASRETATDGVRLAALLDSVGATMLQATPATWNMLLQSGWKGHSSLRVISGGEPISRELIQELAKRTEEIWNVYGPTEATVCTTAARMEPDQDTVLIGRPIPTYTTYILDEHLQPVPVGVVGELYIGGSSLARGYLNRPDLTKAAFLPHPFAEREGERLYKTGDLARYRACGRIEHLGRADGQVKVRGFRIELGEIESVLLRHEAVRDAVAAVREVAGDKRLIAYLVLDGGASPDAVQWRSYLRERVPAYMVPSAFMILESLPLSPNGKVDRKALPEPDAAAHRSEAYVAPRTEMEKRVADIWSEILHVGRMGVYDNFFEAGGHSLLATRVMSRLAEACSVQVPLNVLFEAPTVAELSSRIERLQEEQQGLEWRPLQRVSREEPLPLSFSQQRLWVLDRLMSSRAVYNIPSALRLQGALDAEAMERALAEIVNRHEVLRTTIAEADGEPVQVIASHSASVLETIDLRAWPEDQREEQVNGLLKAETERKFDLAVGPLARFTLVQVADEEHVLILSFHHIISDGWSMEVLFSELSQLYAAYAAGEESPLEPLPIQYADYAVWQRQWLAGDVLNGQLAYWSRKLADLPVLQFPTDRPRPPVQTHNGSLERFELTKELTDALHALSQEQGATLYMTLLGAFQILLARYSGQEDIAVGTPIAGRQRGEVESLIGFFVNTLVMRADLSGDPSFRDVLNRVRETALDAYAHQDVPFEKLVEELQPERDMSRSPLFQVVFVLQNTSMEGPQLGDLHVHPIEPENLVSKFDLTLTMFEQSGVLNGGFEYNTDLFDRATIARLAGHLRTLLEGIAANPDLAIDRLPLLTERERHQLLVEWNETSADVPQNVCPHQLVEAQVERTPDSIAVRDESKQLTYRELNEQANRLAHRLQKIGVGPDVLVGLMFERSVEMVVSILAVLKAGGAYMPLDPTHPPERLEYLIEDSQAHVLLTQESGIGNLQVQTAQILFIDRDQAEIAAEPAVNPLPASAAHNLMYVIYTSGSTGRPKGVEIEHASLVSFLSACQDYLQMREDDVMVTVTSVTFDPTVLEIFMSLVHGATVVMVSRETAMDGVRLAALLDAQKATVMQATPATWNMLLQAGWKGRPELRIMTGGDTILREVVNELAVRTQSVTNAYGPTEATICFMAARMEVSDDPVLIGRPFANATAYVLDKHLQPVPIGVAGELYVGGRQLARGYRNRPDLTEAAFLPHPFAEDAGERIYKTGDMVRYRGDGTVEHLGRIDGQVKIRGYRIELGEIESVLMQHEGIRDAAVVVREAAPGDKRLVAYLVIEGEEDVKEWKAHLREKLPSFMIPSAFVVLEAMPLTPNGKVDRKGLPMPETFGSGSEDYVPPTTAHEKTVASIWAEVLRTERIGIHDNFFEAGGHSLLATQVMSRLAGAFSVQVPLKVLFEAPTVAQLASQIERLQQEGEEAGLIPLQAVSRDEPLPLSFAQQRLWVLELLMTDESSAAYNLPGAIRLHGSLDVPALEQTLREITLRHEVLRTTFAEKDGEPVQVIAPDSSVVLEKADLSGWTAEERDEQVNHLLQKEIQRPFDLAGGPLMRATLVKVQADEHVLVLNFHHIISDGWSMDVLFRELIQLYTAFAAGEESPLEPLPIQYADYAVWQRAWLEGEVMDGQLAYWKQKLAGLPVLQLPTDRPRPPVQTHNGRLERFELTQELTDSLQTLSQQQGATLYMTLLAAFQTLLARYSGQEDIVVGTPIAGRHRGEVESLIGFFVNTLAMRTDLSGEPSFRDVLNRVRETALDAYAHQDVPFEKLVEELQPERDMSRSPLFQVVFTLQNTPTSDLEFADLRISQLEPETQVSKFDLTLTMWEQSGVLSGGIEYNTDLFDSSTIARMAGHLRTLLEGIAANPDRTIDRLPLLTEQERRQLLVEWNETGADVPQDVCVQQLVEAQAERTPDRIVVRFEDKHLTYRELNEQANRVAHRLQKDGVGPDVLVGVLFERSVEMVVAILAVVKAGGAYVPLDPSYPPERLAYLLEDSQAPVLLTQESLAANLQAHQAQVLCFDRDQAEIALEPATNPAHETTADNLVYVIYTSGSTGRPKGVLIEHAALVNFLSASQEFLQMKESDVLVSVTSVAFDPTVIDLFLPLVHGACVAIASRETAMDGVRLAALLDAEQATIMQATPATWNLLLQAGWKGRAGMRIMSGGDAFPREVINELAARTQGVINAYGPTEATIISTSARMEVSGEPVHIGRPLANTTAYILDEHLQPVPIGVAGELYVGGRQLARGYLNRPDLTEAAFLPHPFADRERLYKTGDMARYRADGKIEHLGRIDGQVKIRGYRIELGEIESVLLQQEGIRDAVVAVQEAEPGDKRLIAYLVIEGEEDAKAWKTHLRDQLPSFMMPSAFVVLDTLPLTPNGKVDRNALPKAETFGTAADEYVAPTTDLEAAVASIWAEVLRVEKIGIHDNFFESGGHSLLATQVMSRLAGAFSVHLPLKVLFEAPTVAQLASQMERLQQEGREAGLIPLQKVSRDQPLPLSFAQQRLWVLDRLMTDESSAAYNLPGATRLHGELHVPALEQALREITLRHEVLRTTFAEVDGEPVQVISTDSTLVLEKVDLGSAKEEEYEDQINRLVREEVQRPFDLTLGPLMRVLLIKVQDDEHVLVLNFHHIISDGWSMDVLFRELVQLYTAFAAGEQSPLEPLPIQYADYAVWQREWLEGEVMDGQLAYWKQKLAALPVLQLPTDCPRPPVQTYNGKLERFELTQELTDSLHTLSQQQGATLYMTLLAAFQTLLARYSGQEDIAVGTPIAGRHRGEVEPLIGFFVNTLVMRTDLSGEPSFRDVLNRVRETALDAYAHQDVPFERLVEELQPERDMSRSPLFQVVFTLQNIQMAGDQPFADLKVSQLEQESQVAKFDLTLSMWDQAGVLAGGIEYNTDLFDASTIARMAGHLRTLLEGIAANPDLAIDRLPLLTEQERHQLLVEWNQTGAEIPQDVCVPQLIEAQVERTPDDIAVRFEDQQLTYRELNEQANRVAHRLQKLGVGPDVLVGLMVERSMDMAIGMLAIVKAGGAYVPLDPSYPSERLLHMLEDAQVSVLLTQERLLAELPAVETNVLCFDRDRKEIDAEPSVNPKVTASASNLMYVIYTSGSTGKPKGVQIERAAFANFLFASNEHMQVQASDVLVAVFSMSFDPAGMDLFLPLVQGATLVIASRETTLDGTRLAALLEHVQATVMMATPSIWNLLLQTGWKGRPQMRVSAGGEALSRELIQELAERSQEVWNAYGPTEATVASTMARMEADGGPVCIGRPFANTEAYILDKHLQPVPIGVAGELYVAGRQLARGYLNRPDLTEAAFLPHPFAEGERMYKTGDLVRYHANGQIEHLGRVDGQVKIRGYRIELGEIESVLVQHDSIQEAVVLVREVVPGDRRLIAYLVLDGGQETDVKGWNAHLRERLPAFMVPSAFVVVDAMPLMPNGKVDRRALAETGTFLLESAAERLAPRDELEQRLLEIWERLLGTSEFGVRDNFFEVGGHSLLAVRLMAELQTEFAVQLPLTSLYQEGTIEQLADLLRGTGGSEGSRSLIPLQVRDSDLKPVFLVHPVFGSVQPYLELARLLGDRSVYGLQSAGLQDDCEPLDSIEEMATAYLEEIRSVQPEGPYQLAGWSLGGLIAVEMTLQLQRQGERVSYLGLLDSTLLAPEDEPDREAYEKTTREEFRGVLPELLGEGFAEELPLELAGLDIEAEMEWFVEQARSRGTLPPGLDAKQLASMYRVIRNNILATGRYQPSGKAERLFLYEASEWKPERPTLDWSTAAETVEVLPVPGNHQTIVKMPHVREVAAKMRQALDRN